MFAGKGQKINPAIRLGLFFDGLFFNAINILNVVL